MKYVIALGAALVLNAVANLLMKVGAVAHPGRLRDLLWVVEADVMGRDSRSLREPPDEAREALTAVLKGLRPSVV